MRGRTKDPASGRISSEDCPGTRYGDMKTSLGAGHYTDRRRGTYVAEKTMSSSILKHLGSDLQITPRPSTAGERWAETKVRGKATSERSGGRLSPGGCGGSQPPKSTRFTFEIDVV